MWINHGAFTSGAQNINQLLAIQTDYSSSQYHKWNSETVSLIWIKFSIFDICSNVKIYGENKMFILPCTAVLLFSSPKTIEQ